MKLVLNLIVRCNDLWTALTRNLEGERTDYVARRLSDDFTDTIQTGRVVDPTGDADIDMVISEFIPCVLISKLRKDVASTSFRELFNNYVGNVEREQLRMERVAIQAETEAQLELMAGSAAVPNTSTATTTRRVVGLSSNSTGSRSKINRITAIFGRESPSSQVKFETVLKAFDSMLSLACTKEIVTRTTTTATTATIYNAVAELPPIPIELALDHHQIDSV